LRRITLLNWYHAEPLSYRRGAVFSLNWAIGA
jgi:hypothetical protein